MLRTPSAGLLLVSIFLPLAPAGHGVALAADVGVIGSRLSITSNASTGKQSLASTQKGLGIAFGAASAASEMSGSLAVYYVDSPSTRGTIPLPAPWSSVDTRTAKFLNKLAPAGPTAARSATVRKDALAKLSAKSTGGLDLALAPGPGGVISIFTMSNAGDGSTHRMCTLYRTSQGSKIQHKSALGRSKLTLSKGVPAACPTCTDGVRNDRETGVDCGGPTCGACGTGQGCSTGSDCQSGLCTNGICEYPTCTGGVKDGSETGIDCGGPVCPDCPPGQGCNTGADCTSRVCTGNLCQAPSCGDGVENGTETDVDCGGSCGACVPFTVTIDTPAHGLFTEASSATVTGHVTGVGPAGADLTINNTTVPLGPGGTFTTTVPLYAPLVFNPVNARLVRRFDGLTAYDRVVVVAGAAIVDGDFSPNGVAMRINDRGFDAIEPIATTLVSIDPSTLVQPGTKVMDNYCYASLGSLCLGTVDVAISGTPPPSVGPLAIAIDSQTGAIDGDISIDDLRVTVNLDSTSGIPIHCELHITVGSTHILGDYGLSPLAAQPTKVDVSQVGDVTVEASNTSHTTDCSGLFGDVTESLIGSAIGDVGALFAGGMQEFLNQVDGNGNTAIAGAIESALAGVDIAGPVGSGLGVDLDAPFTAIDEDPDGITFAAHVAATSVAVAPGAPDLLASYHVDEAFPTFGTTSPVQHLPYGIGLGISTSGFNQLLKSQIEGGLLQSTITEIDLGGGPIPLTSGLLAALFTPFGQIQPPTTPIAIRVSPTIAPVLTGDPGPAGELGELRTAHILVEFVQEAGQPSEQVRLVLAVDARIGLNLAFQPGGIGFALSTPTAADVTVSLLRNPLGVSEAALQGFLPSVLAGFLPDLASALQSFPLPSFLGLSLSGVEVSRNGQYYAIFADLTPACVDGSTCPSGVCLGGTCQAPSCGDGLENGAETDVDCGGGSCPGCGTGDGCFLMSDCAVGGCSGGVCQPTCTSNAQCPSGVCLGGYCRVANCADGAQNGSETGIDCGGPSPYCVRCAAGQTCASGADCASGVCTSGVCQAPSCTDGIKNGTETDVDCGGSCPGCGLGKVCTAASDCASSVCGANARCTCGNRSFTFTVNSNSGGVFDSAEWPGGTSSQSSSSGCSVTINRPGGNIDLVCSLSSRFSVQSYAGFSQCFGAGGEDGDGCQPWSCPPAGLGSCCEGRPSCSAALNGSGSARYLVTCLE